MCAIRPAVPPPLPRTCASQAGSKGFSGCFANFHPELYHWLYHSGAQQPELAQELAIFLAMAAATEALGYPKNAKIYHQRLGTFASAHCRVTSDDVLEKFWGLTAQLDHIRNGTELYRKKIGK